MWQHRGCHSFFHVNTFKAHCHCFYCTQGFTYVAPSVLEEMSKPHRSTARSPRRPRYHQNDQCRLTPFSQRGMTSKQTPPHLQPFARPSPQDEIMEVQGVPIV